MLLHTQIVSSHLILVYYFSGICLFSVNMATASTLKEYFHALLINCYGPILLVDVHAWGNVKIDFISAYICDLWGLTCSLSTPVILKL